MNNLPYDPNEYINQEGNFCPEIKIISNQVSDKKISMGQFAGSFIYGYMKDPLILDE